MMVWKLGRGGDAEVEEFSMTIFFEEMEGGLSVEQVSLQSITSACNSKALVRWAMFLGSPVKLAHHTPLKIILLDMSIAEAVATPYWAQTSPSEVPQAQAVVASKAQVFTPP
jgi:hypothetical protein